MSWFLLEAWSAWPTGRRTLESSLPIQGRHIRQNSLSFPSTYFQYNHDLIDLKVAVFPRCPWFDNNLRFGYSEFLLSLLKSSWWSRKLFICKWTDSSPLHFFRTGSWYPFFSTCWIPLECVQWHIWKKTVFWPIATACQLRVSWNHCLSKVDQTHVSHSCNMLRVENLHPQKKMSQLFYSFIDRERFLLNDTPVLLRSVEWSTKRWKRLVSSKSKSKSSFDILKPL